MFVFMLFLYLSQNYQTRLTINRKQTVFKGNFVIKIDFKLQFDTKTLNSLKHLHLELTNRNIESINSIHQTAEVYPRQSHLVLLRNDQTNRLKAIP